MIPRAQDFGSVGSIGCRCFIRTGAPFDTRFVVLKFSGVFLPRTRFTGAHGLQRLSLPLFKLPVEIPLALVLFCGYIKRQS